MDKVYKGCMLVDENELTALMRAVQNEIYDKCVKEETFNELTKIYVKLLKEKEDIQRERAKCKPETESI